MEKWVTQFSALAMDLSHIISHNSHDNTCGKSCSSPISGRSVLNFVPPVFHRRHFSTAFTKKESFPEKGWDWGRIHNGKHNGKQVSVVVFFFTLKVIVINNRGVFSLYWTEAVERATQWTLPLFDFLSSNTYYKRPLVKCMSVILLCIVINLLYIHKHSGNMVRAHLNCS